ncbi:MAG: hypothetical protein HQ568_12000, partial [Calditrichaeota bacterium]|nr:hypothetical protein [Calditrichota bacterium]
MLFLLCVFLLLWVQNNIRVVENPRKYPYRLESCGIDSAIDKPTYIQSLKFSSDSSHSLLLFNQEQNYYKLSLLNENFEPEYSRNIGAHNNIKDIGFTDVNNDGIDELLLSISFPAISETDASSPINNTHIWVRDKNDQISTLDRLTPTDVQIDTNAHDSEIPLSVTARVIYETDHVTPSSSGEYFAVGVWGTGSANASRWVFIYRAGNPPKRIAQIKTPFYPTNGKWHNLADGRMVLTVTGSSYKYGSNDPLKWDGESDWILKDFIDGVTDAIIQIGENGDILWTLQLNVKVGETGIWADPDPMKPLIAFYHQELFPTGDAHEKV